MASVGEIKAKLTMDTKDFKRGMNDAKREMDSATTKSKSLRREMAGIQQASLAIGTAVVAGMGAAVAVAANFEQQMANVKAVSGASADEMARLSELAQELGKTTQFSASEAAAGIEELIKAGVSVEQIIGGGLAGALDLAAAGNLQLADAAEIASTALNAFRDDNLSVVDAANVLAGAANASATDVMEMKFGLSQVAAVASGVGMSFNDTATALAVFAQNGLKGSDAGTSLKTMLQNLQPTTKEQIALFKEMGLMTQEGANQFFTANGELKNLNEIAAILQKSMGGMTDQQRMLTMEMIFGSDAIRAGNILYKEGADGVNAMWDAMSKVTAADVAKVKMDTLLGSFKEFQSAMEGLGIAIGNEFLPMFTEIVRGGTDLVRLLGELNPATVATGIKMAGAAAGIALVGSTLVKLTVTLRGLMLAMGPAGWVITGLSIIGGLLVGVKDNYDRLNKVNLENVNTMTEQHKSLETSISKYDDLKMRSRLTNDELARFVDINSEINKTANPQIIESLRNEQIKLQEKSGLTNEELQLMLQINDEIIETVPTASKTITDQGNALLLGTEAAKKYNKEQLEMIRLELETQRVKAEANMNRLLIEEKRLKEQIKELNKDQIGLEKDIAEQVSYVNEETRKLNEAKANGQEHIVTFHEENIRLAEVELQKMRDQNVTLHEELLKKKEKLGLTQEEIKKLDEVKGRMVSLELAQAGLNAKHGEELKTIDSEILKLQEKRKEIERHTPLNMRNTEEYREGIGEIDRQVEALYKVKSRVEDIIGKANDMNFALGKSINKEVTINERVRRHEARMGGNTEYHTGGRVGHKPINQLHVGGLASKFASTPLHNEIDVRLLRNEMVLTEAQQANLMRMIDAGSTPKKVEEPSHVMTHEGPKSIEIPLIVNGRELARAQIDDINALQKQQYDNTKARRGLRVTPR